MKNKHFVSYASGDYNLSNFNTILHLRICILSFFTETPVLVFVFHSSFDVGCSMFDVHLLICSMFIFFSPSDEKNNLALIGYNRLRVLCFCRWNTQPAILKRLYSILT